MEALAKEKTMCVLATVSGGQPHCSLMAYAADDACRRIYMVTRKSTRKYKNLLDNPGVSLLIDTRGEGERGETKALTIEGTYEPVTDPQEQKTATDLLLRIHPDLKIFMDHPESVLICIRIRSFLLLEGFTDARYKPVDDTPA